MVDLLTVLVISFLAGLVGSITGLGGASITTPLLTLAGVPIKYAIAAGIVSIIATSSGAAASYVRGGLSNVKAAMFLEMFTVVGAIIGAIITIYVSARLLYFLFAGFLLTSFIGIRRHLGEELPTNVNQDRAARWLGLKGVYYDHKLGREVSYKLTRPIAAGGGMFIAGVAAGMLGIGAGAFKVAVHELIMRMPSKVSSATSTFIIGMTALAGASVYFSSGLLYLTLAAPMVLGTTLGAVVGSRILGHISNRVTRLFFLVVVFVLFLQMLLRGILA